MLRLQCVEHEKLRCTRHGRPSTLVVRPKRCPVVASYQHEQDRLLATNTDKWCNSFLRLIGMQRCSGAFSLKLFIILLSQ